MKRKYGNRRKQKRERSLRKILIMCEDEKSSRLYLSSFPYDRNKVAVECLGMGMNTDSLVEAAIERKGQAKKRKEPYAEIWVVFDRDDHPNPNWKRAFDLAYGNDIKACWSNECFEIWYLLHFSYRITPIGRTELIEEISNLLGGGYEKSDEDTFQKLQNRLPTALENARRLAAENGPSNTARNINPSTLVHELVETLLKLKPDDCPD